jgi:ABC-type nitrate/sulfonate/bicarbonate transport system substrate-binding protein
MIGDGYPVKPFFWGLFALAMVPAAPAAAQTIRLALISEGVNTWPLYVAQEKGFFRREGLDVQVTLTRSSVKQLDELRKGGYDIGFQQADHVVRAVEEGSDLFALMAMAHAPGLTLVGAPDVPNVAGLKGRVIAVDGATTGYALLLRKLLADNGLKAGDYTFKEFGGSQERFDALKSGAAAASWLNPPFDRRLLADGFRSLATTLQAFPDYPGSVAAARRSWASAHAQELKAFIRAYVAAYAWLQDPANTEEAIKLLPARLNVDGAAARNGLEQFSKRPRAQITADGLKQVIDVYWEAEGLKTPKGTPEKYLDLSYLEAAGK